MLWAASTCLDHHVANWDFQIILRLRSALIKKIWVYQSRVRRGHNLGLCGMWWAADGSSLRDLDLEVILRRGCEGERDQVDLG